MQSSALASHHAIEGNARRVMELCNTFYPKVVLGVEFLAESVASEATQARRALRRSSQARGALMGSDSSPSWTFAHSPLPCGSLDPATQRLVSGLERLCSSSVWPEESSMDPRILRHARESRPASCNALLVLFSAWRTLTAHCDVISCFLALTFNHPLRLDTTSDIMLPSVLDQIAQK